MTSKAAGGFGGHPSDPAGSDPAGDGRVSSDPAGGGGAGRGRDEESGDRGTPSSAATSRAVAAAEMVFERVMAEVEPDGSAERAGRGRSGQLQLKSSLARSVDRYADLLQRAVSSLADEITETLVGQPAEDSAPTTVTLGGTPGNTAGAFVWIHNTSAELLPEFRLRLTDLTHSDGHRLSSMRRAIDPAIFAASAQTRRSAWVSVTVPADALAGIYYGHILAEGLPDAAVSVRLVVR